MCNDRKRQGVMETTLSWYKENAFLYAEKTKYSLVYDALGEFLSRLKEKEEYLILAAAPEGILIIFWREVFLWIHSMDQRK